MDMLTAPDGGLLTFTEHLYRHTDPLPPNVGDVERQAGCRAGHVDGGLPSHTPRIAWVIGHVGAFGMERLPHPQPIPRLHLRQWRRGEAARLRLPSFEQGANHRGGEDDRVFLHPATSSTSGQWNGWPLRWMIFTGSVKSSCGSTLSQVTPDENISFPWLLILTNP